MKKLRLKHVATSLNISVSTIVEFFVSKGIEVENKPTSLITTEQFDMLADELALAANRAAQKVRQQVEPVTGIKVIGNIKFKGRQKPLNCELNLDSLIQALRLAYEGLRTPKITPQDLFSSDILTSDFAESVKCFKPKSGIAQSTIISLIQNLPSKKSAFAYPSLEGYKELYKWKSDSSKSVYKDLFFSEEHVQRLTAEIVKAECYGFGSVKRYIKALALGKRCVDHSDKRPDLDNRQRIQRIITPQLFHVFSGEEDESRAAINSNGFSIFNYRQHREACSNFTGFKTRLQHGRQKDIYRQGQIMQPVGRG
ncbi:hypothetical protein EFA69_14605 [Rufibacter immobilis]|uniref:Uncharacterized protein n=1 Tax=Rufibacter immobilis TaxID=1348778 RepID=A0A3M9MQ86_9BACT|nr:translation initiation factor IF-2 N-terminal domain-containing protein [Rufibacter immobilis]RNI27367.1 hypothetical protein EFA69_14605 [Rufibacter immobilis]